MFTWAERLAALLADNRAALDKAISSQRPDDWQVVIDTGKALRDFLATHAPQESPTMSNRNEE